MGIFILYAKMKDFKRTKHNPTIGMTNEEVTQYWINQSIEKFGNSFDYSEVGTISKKIDPCIIICKAHGKLETSFYNHLGSEKGCFDCGDESCRESKRMTFENFIKRLDEINPNRNFKILSREFKGCQIKHEKLYTQDEFGICKVGVTILLRGVSPNIKTAVFPNLYNINRYKQLNKFNHLDFSKTDYKGALNYTTVNCRIHGEFPTKPNWVLNGYGCPHCANKATGDRLRSNIKDFTDKANKVHGENTYDYSKSIYLSALKKLEIGCNIEGHGTFWQKPNGHLDGNGCPICGVENGGYGKSDYVKQAKGRNGVMYILKLKNDDEEFYKIGITFQGIKTRFSGGNSLPYDYKIMYEYKCDAGCTWDLEKEHHKRYKPYQYFPNLTFAGHTECFTIDLPVEEIISCLESI